MHHWNGVFGVWRREFLKGAFTVDGLVLCFSSSMDHGVSLACLISSFSSSFLFVHTLASREGWRLFVFSFSPAVLESKAVRIINICHHSSLLSSLSLEASVSVEAGFLLHTSSSRLFVFSMT
jgi:hypothetical protein